jgi:hypothetical protein
MMHSSPESLILRSLAAEHLDPIQRILTARGAFTAEEIRVAIQLLEQSLRKPEGDYLTRVLLAGGEVIGYSCFGRAPFTRGCV